MRKVDRKQGYKAQVIAHDDGQPDPDGRRQHSARTRSGQDHHAPCGHCVTGPGVPFARLPARTCKGRPAHSVPDLTPTPRGPRRRGQEQPAKAQTGRRANDKQHVAESKGKRHEPTARQGNVPGPGPRSGPNAGSANPCGRAGETLVRRCQVKAGDLAGSQRLPFPTGKDAGSCSLCPAHARRRRLARTRRLPPRI